MVVVFTNVFLRAKQDIEMKTQAMKIISFHFDILILESFGHGDFGFCNSVIHFSVLFRLRDWIN